MTIAELLKQFADPNVIQSLSIMDKFLAGLVTTFLGMGITFIALIILQVIISLMDRMINRTSAASVKSPVPVSTTKAASTGTAIQQDDNELVAILTSVIAMKMKTSVGNIVIRNIEKIEDRSPAWNRAGIIEQMNSRF